MKSIKTQRSRLLLIQMLMACMIGCSRESIPTYPQMSTAAAMKIVSDRNEKIHTISATGLITLTKPDGDSVRLDAAVVLSPPDQARIRAWKFGRAIFDMTLTNNDVWIVAPKDDHRREQFMAAGSNTGKLTHQWLNLLTHFQDANTTIKETDSHYVLKKPDHDLVISCMIDRKSLAARSYILTDASGKTRFSLQLSRYRQFGDLIWPCRIEATGPTGNIQIDLDDVELNSPVEPAAFTPPGRAEKLEGH